MHLLVDNYDTVVTAAFALVYKVKCPVFDVISSTVMFVDQLVVYTCHYSLPTLHVNNHPTININNNNN